jgi:Fe-S cluster assembly iron-binding protein IscA
LALDEPKEDAKPYTVNEIDLLIADDVMPFTDGNEIDYINSPHSQGFVIAPVMGGGCC